MIKKTLKAIVEFIKLETAGGIILFFFALIAIVMSNSPLLHVYTELRRLSFNLTLGSLVLSQTLLHWVNDGFMAIFFLLVGLEIKREVVCGELNTSAKLALPAFAALGGMLFPAIIYLIINYQDPIAARGWAIPCATDIAFALGVLSLLGKRIPIGLKVFLTALAILDDLGAIIIIAIFYTDHLVYSALLFALVCIFILLCLNLFRVYRVLPYLLVGSFLWFFVFRSGIHPTLAGVALAFTIPIKNHINPNYSPLRRLEHALHPWVAFLILPLFAFFNAGVSFSGISWHTFIEIIPLGIGMGLLLGKQLGVMLASWIAIKLGFAKLPHGVNWFWLYGIALICGIGFTMSLFIGSLAFDHIGHQYSASVRLGVIMGSLLSGIIGYGVLNFLSKKGSGRAVKAEIQTAA